MEESKKIKLGLGTVSLSEKLGSYYIDMRPAMVHYTSNIYGGKFDGNGVPMVGDTDGSFYYSPVNIAQYGFMLHAQWLEYKEESLWKTLVHCIKILESLKTEDEKYAVWYHKHHQHHYNIPPPWASAMAQGEIISFYLRIYQESQENNLLETAKKAYRFLKIEVKDGGVRYYDTEGNLWFEEYPSTPASCVLNGFIYTIWGLYDLYRVTGDKNIEHEIQLCIKTLKHNLHKFDAGYWSFYDLYKKELVRFYYQKNVHVPQLEVMYILSGDNIFSHYKQKWEKTVNPLNFALVLVMYRIWPRWQKLIKLWKN